MSFACMAKRKSAGRNNARAPKRRRVMGRRKTPTRRRRRSTYRDSKSKGWLLDEYIKPRGQSTLKTQNLPQVLQTRLTYYPDQSWSALGTSVIGYQEIVYRINGAYDPEVAVGGGQPRMYDKWSALYARYVVKALEFTVKVYDMDSSGPYVLGYYTSTSSGAEITTANNMEQAWEILSNPKFQSKARIHSFDGQGRGLSTLKGRVTASRHWRESNPEDMVAAVTANPTDEAYLHVFVISPANAAVTPTAYTRLVYDMSFFDRVEIVDA